MSQFDRFVGKILEHVSDELTADAKHHGYRVNVLDPDFKRNIDREPDRLNVRVDFHIREIVVG
jgi:hypothetical protein